MSVIVPVYNPGANIDDCIDSLLGQSLPPEEYEVIFVDDGSTDETPARLDALAAEHEHVRVEHIPNSGWPGKPRNIGIEMARGEYVYFVDNDDWIGKRRAASGCTTARVRDEADIVIGKVVGEGKFVARSVFKRDRQRRDARVAAARAAADAAQAVPQGAARRARHPLPRGPPPARGPRVRDARLLPRAADLGAGRLPLLPLGAARGRGQRVLRGARAGRATTTTCARCSTSSTSTWSRARCATACARTGTAARCSAASAAATSSSAIRRTSGRSTRRSAGSRSSATATRSTSTSRSTPACARACCAPATTRGSRRSPTFEGGLRTEATVVELEPDEEGVGLLIEARIAGDAGPLLFERDGERVRWTLPAALAGRLDPDELDVTDVLDRSYADVLIWSARDGTEFLLRTDTETRLEPAGRGTTGSPR